MLPNVTQVGNVATVRNFRLVETYPPYCLLDVSISALVINLKNRKMSKMFLQKTEYEETEIELPFYSYVQGEDEEVYVKIDETYFYQITFFNTGKVEFMKFKNHKNIASIWHTNKTNSRVWKTALSDLKNSMYNFLS